MDRNNPFKRLADWVNADENLPVPEEQQDGHGEDAHDDGHAALAHGAPEATEEAHEAEPAGIGHGHSDNHHGDRHGAADKAQRAPQAGEPSEYVGDADLEYPDEIISTVQEQDNQKTYAQNDMASAKEQKARLKGFQKFYGIMATLLAVVIISLLLVTVTSLPEYGGTHNPTINEVYKRYVEQGVEDTGAVNLVAGMILDYRAFDTLGESFVLFTAVIGVIMLLRTGSDDAAADKKEGGQ